jgi:hypothetical protein
VLDQASLALLAGGRTEKAMRVHVGGDGSNLALVDTRAYRSFVGADWCEDGLLYKHLAAEIGQAHALVWAVGFESDWKVDIEAGHSTERGFRAFVGDIVNTGNSLHLVNYDSLTMAAQFDDILLPDEETADYEIALPSGAYRIRVVQMFDPASAWLDVLGDDLPAFRIEYQAIDAADVRAPADASPQWWDEP